MIFRDAVRAAPRAHDPARGRDALARLDGAARGGAEALIEGAAGSSPFLAASIAKEAEWLAGALDREAGEVFEAVLAAIPAPGGARGEMERALRRAKRRAGLWIALADLGGIWDLDAATGALSRLADVALEAAAREAMARERSGPLVGATPASAGLAALGMGKHGAEELNYSSDIDIICFFDETRWDRSDWGEVRARLIAVVQATAKMLSEATGDGYVFRTDLRLRPDAGSTPVCMAMEAAERYYESVGRTWERAAYIKARPVAGDRAAGARFLETLGPFVWRRNLDFAALEDIADIRRKIREHRVRPGGVDMRGADVKLGRGGIREIEFFAQTQQLILGGRNPGLRGRRTRGTLRDLEEAGVIDAEMRGALDAAYVAHRTLEHRIQMIEDAQTHLVPVSDEGRARVAALGGWADVDAMEREVVARFGDVAARAEAFFSPSGHAENPLPQRRVETEETLAARGFVRVDDALRLLDRLHTGKAPALRTARARATFKRILPELLDRLAEAASPDEALLEFDRFIARLPTGVQLFAMFEARPQLLSLISEICATAPRLGAHLGRRAGALDAVLERDFFEPLPPVSDLRAALADRIAEGGGGDYERALDIARIWAREMRFRVGAQTLRGISDCDEAMRAYSAVAEASLGALWPVVGADFASRHGPPPGAGAAVLAMGRLGSEEMNAGSDLDLIFVYDPGEAESSEGDRPLAVGLYYARLAQALVAALKSPTAEGALYDVDMRLRPSGRSGPLATRLSAFRRYQKEDAWTWEHMALTRARPVAGAAEVQAGAAAAIAEALSEAHDREKTLADAAEMLDRLDAAHGAARRDPWAFKLAHGGLMEIEFVAQSATLIAGLGGREGTRRAGDALRAAAAAGALDGEVADDLIAAHRLQAGLQTMERLAVEGGFSPDRAGVGLTRAMVATGGAASLTALEETVLERQARAARLVAAWFGRA